MQMQGDPSDPELMGWWRASPFNGRIEIVLEPARCPAPMTGVAIIVNSACLHRVAIESALAGGYHVVSEKPLTLSHRESQQVLVRSQELGLKLFSTNTYLFADYLNVLRRDWLEGKHFSEIQLTWADAGAEIRHGQARQYDSSLPVVFDVLPHIANIVLATHGGFRPGRSELTVRAGGSAATALFACDGVVIEANMARNAARRSRRARFAGRASPITIDFSEEPGVVWSDGGRPVPADPAWQGKSRPVAEMLRAVKTYFDHGEMDDRLDPGAALLGNQLIDSVADSYVEQQIALLSAQRTAPAWDLAYAAKEAQAIEQRALPFLSQESPLRRLAQAGKASW
jgi:predicted dehydrogenase